jgi:hypothetical protein
MQTGCSTTSGNCFYCPKDGERQCFAVRRLPTVEALKQLKYRYCVAVDTNYDANAIASMFTEDGVWDGGDLGYCSGRDAIRGVFAQTPSMVLGAHCVTISIAASPIQRRSSCVPMQSFRYAVDARRQVWTLVPSKAEEQAIHRVRCLSCHKTLATTLACQDSKLVRRERKSRMRHAQQFHQQQATCFS